MPYTKIHAEEEEPIKLSLKSYGDKPFEFPSSDFDFTGDSKPEEGWSLVGYFTVSKQSPIGQSLYKLFERYNSRQDLYEYSGMLEGDVRVMLPSSHRRISSRTVFPSGSVPCKVGPHDVTRY